MSAEDQAVGPPITAASRLVQAEQAIAALEDAQQDPSLSDEQLDAIEAELARLDGVVKEERAQGISQDDPPSALDTFARSFVESANPGALRIRGEALARHPVPTSHPLGPGGMGDTRTVIPGDDDDAAVDASVGREYERLNKGREENPVSSALGAVGGGILGAPRMLASAGGKAASAALSRLFPNMGRAAAGRFASSASGSLAGYEASAPALEAASTLAETEDLSEAASAAGRVAKDPVGIAASSFLPAIPLAIRGWARMRGTARGDALRDLEAGGGKVRPIRGPIVPGAKGKRVDELAFDAAENALDKNYSRDVSSYSDFRAREAALDASPAIRKRALPESVRKTMITAIDEKLGRLRFEQGDAMPSTETLRGAMEKWRTALAAPSLKKITAGDLVKMRRVFDQLGKTGKDSAAPGDKDMKDLARLARSQLHQHAKPYADLFSEESRSISRASERNRQLGLKGRPRINPKKDPQLAKNVAPRIADRSHGGRTLIDRAAEDTPELSEAVPIVRAAQAAEELSLRGRPLLPGGSPTEKAARVAIGAADPLLVRTDAAIRDTAPYAPGALSSLLLEGLRKSRKRETQAENED